MYNMASYEKTKEERRTTDAYKSPIQKLLEDPNIRIVTDVPGLSWHVEYKVKPTERKQGKLVKAFRRVFRM